MNEEGLKNHRNHSNGGASRRRLPRRSMAAAPSRCLLVTGPPVSPLKPLRTLLLSPNNRLTAPASGTCRAWGRQRWSCGCSKPSEALTRTSPFADSTPVLRCLALSNSGSFHCVIDDHEFYQFRCAISVCRRGERGRRKGRILGCHARRQKWTPFLIQGFQVAIMHLCLF